MCYVTIYNGTPKSPGVRFSKSSKLFGSISDNSHSISIENKDVSNIMSMKLCYKLNVSWQLCRMSEAEKVTFRDFQETDLRIKRVNAYIGE